MREIGKSKSDALTAAGVILFVLLLAPVTSSSETVYKCDNNGRITFSQTPCSDAFETITIENKSPSVEVGKGRFSTNLEKLSTESSLKSAEIDIRNVKRKINQLEGASKSLGKKRDKNLSELQKELKRTFPMKRQREIVAQMEKVKDKYREDQERLSNQIHKYKMDLIDRERAYRMHASSSSPPSKESEANWCPCNGTYNCYDERNIRYCITSSGIKRYRSLK